MSEIYTTNEFLAATFDLKKNETKLCLNGGIGDLCGFAAYLQNNIKQQIKIVTNTDDGFTQEKAILCGYTFESDSTRVTRTTARFPLEAFLQAAANANKSIFDKFRTSTNQDSKRTTSNKVIASVTTVLQSIIRKFILSPTKKWILPLLGFNSAWPWFSPFLVYIAAVCVQHSLFLLALLYSGKEITIPPLWSAGGLVLLYLYTPLALLCPNPVRWLLTRGLNHKVFDTYADLLLLRMDILKTAKAWQEKNGQNFNIEKLVKIVEKNIPEETSEEVSTLQNRHDVLEKQNQQYLKDKKSDQAKIEQLHYIVGALHAMLRKTARIKGDSIAVFVEEKINLMPNLRTQDGTYKDPKIKQRTFFGVIADANKVITNTYGTPVDFWYDDPKQSPRTQQSQN